MRALLFRFHLTHLVSNSSNASVDLIFELIEEIYRLNILPSTYCILSLKYDTCIKCLASSVSLLLRESANGISAQMFPCYFRTFEFCISVLIHNSTHCRHIWSALLLAKNQKNMDVCAALTVR